MHNYYDLEEDTPKEIIETKIENLLEQIKMEKYKVVGDMYSERNQMDAKEREKEGKPLII